MKIETIVDDIAKQIGLSNLTVSLGIKCQLNKIAVQVLSISNNTKSINTLVARDEIIALKEGCIDNILNKRIEIAIRTLAL
jgi:hypothetical protein